MVVIAETRQSVAEKEWFEILERERRVRMICSELNHFTDLKLTLITIMKHVSALSGCNAIGIRLQDGQDYPYYVYQGFSELFIENDHGLGMQFDKNMVKEDLCGYGEMLDSLCNGVVQNNDDPDIWNVTPYGSHWTNTNHVNPGEGRRGFLIASEYASVALIPIKSSIRTLGILHVNDMQKGRFTPGIIADLELVAGQVGLAIQNSMTYSRLRKAYLELQVISGLIPICAECKNIRNSQGRWETIERYFGLHTHVEFTHDICPACLKRLYPDLCLE